MKKINVFVLFLLLVPEVFSQQWGYDNNRIAISHDGNSAPDYEHKWPTGDPDDIGAAAAGLAIVAKLGLQDKLVHLSYNNFIDAPSGPEAENKVKITVEGAAQLYGGFNPCVFFDVTTQLDAAKYQLAGEMAKSTADDPLYFIHAGLAEFVYQAVEIVVNQGNSDALSHVYLVSHSGFNETHLRRDWHHTWDDIQALAGNRIQYKKIPDQNGCWDHAALWCSEKDYAPWYWMRDHEAPGVKFIYDRMVASGLADISDCGMLFYLLNGDDAGSPTKFQTFLGAGIPVKNMVTCEKVAASGFSVEESEVSMQEFEAFQLTYQVFPDNAYDKAIHWTVQDEALATISGYGRIYAKKPGTTKIIGITNDGSFKDTISITVTETPQCVDISYNAIQDITVLSVEGFVPAYKDNSRNAIAVDAVRYKDKFAAVQKEFKGVSGYYNITLTTLTEEYGESTYRIRVGGELVGECQNPETESDMSPYAHMFDQVYINDGDIIQIESNTHSNGKIPEGDGFAYARGRWREIAFECSEGCLIEETDGLLVFEAERFALAGDWKLGTDESKASGGKYIYFDGPNSYTSVNTKDLISYTFRINNPGTYTFKWMMRQPEGERGTDKGNDAWFYFPGDIAKGAGTALTHFEKFVGRSTDDFTFNGQADLHGNQPWVNVVFEEAGDYTLNLGGRSHGLQLDRIILYKGMTFDEASVKIDEISESSECGDLPLVDTTRKTATPKCFTTTHVDHQITIDGNHEESWDVASWNYGAFDANGADLPSGSDLSFSFKSVFDINNIYFFVKVVDDKKVKHTGNNTDYWNADNVELFFNPDNKNGINGSYGSDALQIRLNYGNDTNLYSGNGTWKGGEYHQGFEYKCVDVESGYVIEARIPWEGIAQNITLEERKRMGFDITVTDVDNELPKDNTIAWANDTKVDNASVDTRKFGTLIVGSLEYSYMDQTKWTAIFADSESDEPDRKNSLKEHAIDGDPETFWHTKWFSAQPELPHEIHIDFGGLYDVSEIHYLSRQDEWGPNGTVGQYEIYISNDLEEWGAPKHVGEFDWGENPSKEDYKILQKIALDSVVRGRYARFLALSETQNLPEVPFTCIAEFNCIGKPYDENKGALGSMTSLGTFGNVRVYPNPAHNTLTISGLETEESQISIYAVSGVNLYTDYLNSGTMNVDISKLNPGIYMLEIENGGSRLNKLFIKE